MNKLYRTIKSSCNLTKDKNTTSEPSFNKKCNKSPSYKTKSESS